MARPARPGAREALLDAARVEFARAGPTAARVEDIARRAGLSKGAFYLHFPTREDALLEIIQRLVGGLEALAVRREELTDQLWATPATGPAALEQRLQAEIALDVELLEVLWRHRALMPVMEGAAGPRGTAIVGGFRQRLRTLTAGRMRARQASGLVRRDLDPAVVADIVMGAYEDFGRRMASLRSKPDLAGWAATFLSVLYQGLLTRRSGLAVRRSR